MSNSKLDVPLPDHEDGDHSQPINLAAPRAPAPPGGTFTSTPGTTSVATQPVTLRAHNEPQKPGLMLQALYIRAPSTGSRPPGPGHVMTPIMGNQVGTSSHFSTKPVFKGLKVNYFSEKPSDKAGATEFKNSNLSGWTVIRMPSADNNQPQGGATTQSGSSTLASNILPSALAGNSSRHMVPTAVHPVISGNVSTSGPMASIIKGTHQVSQVGHVIHPPYSTHVPRGPAAVASINSAPKSAVATPILRAPHSSGTMTLASSVIAPHAASSLRARSPTMVTGRTATPPVVSSMSHQQVIDLQKTSIGHSLSTQSQVGLPSRSVDISGASIRPGISPSSAITITKPISISQPIVQHLQQVSDKSYLKTVSSITSSNNSPSNSTPAHQNSSHLSGNHPSSTDVQNVSVVPTITRATLSNISGSSGYPAGIVQLSAAPSVSTLRPSLVQPHSLHALTSAGNLASTPSAPHQTLTVISAKPLQSATPPVTHSTQLNRATSVCGSNVVSSSGAVVTAASVLPSTHSRLLNAPNSVHQGSAIPIAKVYPQSLPVQVKVDSTELDNTRASGLTTTGSSSTNVALTQTTTTSVTASPSQAAVSDKRPDSSASVRVTSLAKHAVGNTNYTSVPSATYLYDQYQNLAVHPYSMSTTNQSFSTNLPSGQIRPLTLSQHGNANMASGMHPSVCVSSSSSTPVQPLNSLMVAVDSRHITLHSPYTTVSGNKPNSEIAHQTTAPIANTSVGSNVSQAPNAHSSTSSQQQQQQQQGSASNHLSPRPSILRKRTNEAITGLAKRNIISSLGPSEPLSPRPEFKSTVNSAMPSPKSTNEQLQENGVVSTTSPDLENGKIPIINPTAVVKKEPGSIDKNILLESPAEASPRKKPRKQLLAANELMETHSSDTEENFDQDIKPDIKEIKTENENVKWVTFSKRPSMSLLSNYRHSWKSRHNHFNKYSDVKPKEEKKASVHELANLKGILQEINAWKIYHLTGQMEDLCDSEESSIERMSRWLDLENKRTQALNGNSLNAEDDRILSKLTDIVKGNLQRSKIAQEQAMESKQQIVKVIDHKPNIVEIVNKYISRRPLKKKEKS